MSSHCLRRDQQTSPVAKLSSKSSDRIRGIRRQLLTLQPPSNTQNNDPVQNMSCSTWVATSLLRHTTKRHSQDAHVRGLKKICINGSNRVVNQQVTFPSGATAIFAMTNSGIWEPLRSKAVGGKMGICHNRDPANCGFCIGLFARNHPSKHTHINIVRLSRTHSRTVRSLVVDVLWLMYCKTIMPANQLKPPIARTGC